MVKLTRPLFADSAFGQVGSLGAFRRGRHGAQFMVLSVPTDRKSPKQLALRACFKTARQQWQALDKSKRSPWGVYWRQYLANHAECQP
jgi:hypothetical protein